METKVIDVEQLAGVKNKLAKIIEMDRGSLVEQWKRCFSHPPPISSSRKFLFMALSYEYQKRECGGLTKTEIKTLKSLVEGKLPTASQNANLGAVLVREWHGRQYRVDVTDDGYVFKNKNWSSLSAIAKDITGAKWSGPRFFGLRS